MFVSYLFVILLCTTPAFGDWKKQHERIAGRVIHIESLRNRGQWASISKHHERKGKYYIEWKDIPQNEVFYECTNQYLVSYADENKEYVKFESICDNFRNRFLTAGYPYNEGRQTVMLFKSSYPSGDVSFHWTVKCENEDVKKCQFISRRFSDRKMVHQWQDGKTTPGRYYLTLQNLNFLYGEFRIYAPNPTDGMVQIFKHYNGVDAPHQYSSEVSLGISTTKTQSKSVTATVSMEIGASFKVFSASASASISSTWATETSQTYSKTTTTKITVIIPAKTTVTLYQLTGYYADDFVTRSQTYRAEQTKDYQRKRQNAFAKVRTFHNVHTIDLTSKRHPKIDGPLKEEDDINGEE